MTWERVVPTVGHWWWDTEERVALERGRKTEDRSTLFECTRCGACVTRRPRFLGVQPCTHPQVDEATPFEHDYACQRLVDEHPSGMTLEEVGEALGVTRERVRQIEAKALRKLLSAVKREGIRLEDVLDLGRDDAA